MYKVIMVALDGSKEAESALEPARETARAFRARLHLVCVEMPRVPRGDEWEMTQADFLDKQSAALRVYLEQLAEPLQETGLEVTTEVLSMGSTIERLLDEVKCCGADLLVLFSHGRSGAARILFGSHAEALNRRVMCPVLVVHPREGNSSSVLSKILVPLDRSAESELALQQAQAFSLAFKSEVRLVTVQEFLEENGSGEWDQSLSEMLDRRRARLQGYLDRLAEPMRLAGIQVSALVLPLGSPQHRILEEARSYGADLITLYSHARRGLSRVFQGSVAERLARSASCPVLMVHGTNRG